jgi:flavin-dependent dehydrogenase
MGRERIQEELGNSMHVFLLDIPNMDFAAVIPKGEYVTICILGKKVDKELTSRFMNAPEVKALLKMEWDEKSSSCCKCMPKINVGMAENFYDDRVVLVGDCGVSKLYKDGIGAAYRTAKACAMTSILHGISKEAFQKFFVPRCKKIERDNSVGKFIFLVVALFRKFGFLRKGMMSMTAKEQSAAPEKRLMSGVLWDTFSGSSTYTNVFLRTIKPGYLFTLAKECALSLFGFSGIDKVEEKK